MNPVPVTVPPVTLILEVPVFLNCTTCELVVPTGTLPKLTLLGVAVSVEVVMDVVTTPVPEMLIFTKLFVAVLPIWTYPVLVTADVGENLIVNVKYAPGARLFGMVIPLTLYMLATRTSLVMETLEVPVFLMTTLTLLLVPTATLPKDAEVGLNDRVPLACARSAVATEQRSSAQASTHVAALCLWRTLLLVASVVSSARLPREFLSRCLV